MIIDPLVYSTYPWGSHLDYGRAISIDADGDAYITGWTGSANYPNTSGAFQTTKDGYYNVFVKKLSFVETGVSNDDLHYRYILYQNYLNPFNPETFIEFELANRSRVKLAVYDVLGSEVKVLNDGEEMEARRHRIKFN